MLNKLKNSVSINETNNESKWLLQRLLLTDNLNDYLETNISILKNKKIVMLTEIFKW